MKSELQVFNFENVEIRTIMLEDGIWFVAKDVSNVLGYSQLGHALRLVDDDDKLLITNKNPLSGLEIPDRGIYLINESGLYSMILNSRREDAKHFKKWITSEVLPSIRKTGSYQMKEFSPAEMFMLQAQVNLENERRLIKVEEEQKQLALAQVETNQRLDKIETASDHFTIIGWYRYVHQAGSLSLADAAKMGRQATKYCTKHEVPMGEVPDPRFGTVRTYPKWVLDDLFASNQTLQ